METDGLEIPGIIVMESHPAGEYPAGGMEIIITVEIRIISLCRTMYQEMHS